MLNMSAVDSLDACSNHMLTLGETMSGNHDMLIVPNHDRGTKLPSAKNPSPITRQTFQQSGRQWIA